VYRLFDCTAAYFGRDVSTLKVFADSTGLNIITNTGFYGAANDRYIPQLAYTLSEKEIAAIWIREFTEGIDQTGIKPGFIKLAFDDGAPSEIDLKLFRAGMLTHLVTGLTLVIHTGNNSAAGQKQLELLVNQKVSPSAWVWAHANQSKDMQVLLEAATKGPWISLDGVKESNVAEYIDKIEVFKAKGLLHGIGYFFRMMVIHSPEGELSEPTMLSRLA
jgi:phosphotriesterase-related protein